MRMLCRSLSGRSSCTQPEPSILVNAAATSLNVDLTE